VTRIVAVGGTGLIGAKVVTRLRRDGHDVVTASRSTGVDTVTGAGLAEALAEAEVVVDTTRPPSSATDAEVHAFFTASTRRMLEAERDAGVRHHVARVRPARTRLPR